MKHVGKFSMDPGRFPGSKYPSGLPLDIVDAGGRVVDDDCIIYFDTETGVVISVVMTRSGHLYLHGIAQQEQMIVKVYPAPLSTRPCRKLWVPPGMVR